MAQPIANIEAFTKECRSVVAQALGNPSISFSKPQSIVNNKLLCVLNGPGSTSAQAKYSYRVVPIFSNIDKNIWLGASLEFQYLQGKVFLVAASVIVFEGEATDEVKIPLLRAEWELSETAPVKHAQPHWHVYAGRINPQPDEATFSDETVDFLADTLEPDAELASWEDAQWFHFAMSSQWHNADAQPIYTEFDETMMKNWLSGCIRYTVEQIHWLYPS
ncbi:MAG TPA: hypothetical protein PKD55_16255 [Bellilinea sp.]|nr:hypothetical protein [Bellilinea sp.]